MARLVRHPSVALRASLVVLALVLSSTISSGRMRLDPDGAAYGSVGARPERGYFSQLPFERVDAVNGDLSLTFTDLVLPGNAGMDLRFGYTYSRQRGVQWVFSFTHVPLFVSQPVQPQSGEWTPALVKADGSTQRLFTGVVSNYWVTTEFWRYDTSTGKLYLPNGWVATYESFNQFDEYYRLDEIEDAYGNTITPAWNGNGQLTSVVQTVDDGGATREREVEFTYDNNLMTMTYDSRSWTYTYGSPSGQPVGTLLSIERPAGPDWTFTYGTDTMTVTTPNGGTVEYAFVEVEGRDVVDEITTGGRAITSGTWAFDYDPGNPATTTVTTPSEREITYVHAWEDGPDGKLWTLTSRSLVEDSTEVFLLERTYTSVAFGSLGNLKVVNTQDITQDGVTYSLAFDYSSSDFADYLQPNSITESNSEHGATRVTTRTFQAFTSGYILPRVDEETVTMGSDSFTRSIEYENGTGFVLSQTAAGITTTFDRDAFGNAASVTDAHDHEHTTAYQWGVPVTMTTPEYTVTRSANEDGTVASETRDGKTTAYTYDALGRPTIVSPEEGDNATTTYASDGSYVVSTRGSTSITTTVDGFGRPIATEDAVGVKTTTTYDNEGRKTFQSAPFTGSSGTGNTFTYDALGRVATVTHADSSYIEYTYSGTEVTITDEIEHSTTQHWQAFGTPGSARLVQVTDADANDWYYTYNVFGSLTEVDAPTGPDRTWTYHATTNLLTSETHPESGTTTYTYGATGLLASKTDARNLTTTYQYDANHRLTSIAPPDPTERITYEYDDAGNRTRMVTGGMESLFTYDDANRLEARQDFVNGKTFSTTYEYDARDNLKKITYPSGRIVQYDYDAANRITKVYGATTGTIYAEDIEYHASGPISALEFGNGESESLTLTSRFRPLRLQSGPLDVTYDYYANGNVYSVDDARGGYDATYTYDVLDRLTGVSGFGATAFTYDAQGNRLTKGTGSPQVSYSYSGTTNRLTSATTTLGPPEAGTFTYDDAGNMTGDGTYTFGYSSRNMMLAATLTSTGAKTRYQYDGDGLRTLKSGPAGPSYYIHGPGGLLLAEYAGSFSKEWPAAATTGLGPDFTLEWSALPSATYVVCVDTVNNNACDTEWVSTSSATSKALTDVAAGTYYWQVKATDSGGTQLADAGTWWSFTINAQGVFGKTSPGGGAFVHTNDVTLSWNSLPGVGYWVCWDTTNNDTCDGGWTPNGSGTSKVLESLSAGTYYWQVKETEEDIQADAGQWWSFTKVTGTTGKLAPLDGTTNHGEDVWVSWSAVADAGYWVCWDTSNNNTCDTGWYPNGASTTKLLEDLSAGTYYWQIKVDPDAGADYETNGGEWWAFTVGSGSPPGSGTSTVTREYVYLGSKLLASIESGTTTTWYHVDVLGSVRAITSSAGATLTRHDYAPFGESTSDLDGDPRRFTGQELDAETALDYYNARYYRNVWGRFTTADDSIYMDPADPQTFNVYAYVFNNPLRWVDPSGHQAQEPICCWNENVTVYADAGGSRWSRFWSAFGGTDFAAWTQEGIDLFHQGPRPGVTGVRLGSNQRWTPEEFWGAVTDAGRRADAVVTPMVTIAATAWGGLAAGAVAAPVLGRTAFLLNNNDYLRIGWGFGIGGVPVFRLAVGSPRNMYGLHAHLDFAGKGPVRSVADFAQQVVAADWTRIGYQVGFYFWSAFR